MIDPEKKEFFSQLPLFKGLSTEDLEDILIFTQPFSIEPDTILFQQGSVPEGMYLLKEGRIKLVANVAGGQQMDLTTLGPGEILGEMGLFDRSFRTATAIAAEPLKGYLFSNLLFDMLRVSMKPSALKIMNCFTNIICQRIRSRIGQIEGTLNELGTGDVTVDDGNLPKTDWPLSAKSSASTLDLSILQLIPLFQQFTSLELEEFIAPMPRWDLPRGQVLFKENDAPQGCFITIRGAVRTSIIRNTQSEQLTVFGPGRIIGILPFVDGGIHPYTGAVREQATLLEIEKTYFDNLCHEGKEIGFKFLQVVNQELIENLRRLTRQISRLVSQERLVVK